MSTTYRSPLRASTLPYHDPFGTDLPPHELGALERAATAILAAFTDRPTADDPAPVEWPGKAWPTDEDGPSAWLDAAPYPAYLPNGAWYPALDRPTGGTWSDRSSAPRPVDVFDRWSRRRHVAADRLAYRGAVRWSGGYPVADENGRTVRHVAVLKRTPNTDRVAVLPMSPDAWHQLATDPDAVADAIALGSFDPSGITRVVLLSTTCAVTRTRFIGAAGTGWYGRKHRLAPATAPTTRAGRVRKVRARAVGAGKRGKAVGPFALSDGALLRRWNGRPSATGTSAAATDDQRVTADAIETLLRTLSPDQPVTLLVTATGDHRTVVVDHAGAAVRVTDPDGRTHGVRSFARRAALAGWTLSDD